MQFTHVPEQLLAATYHKWFASVHTVVYQYGAMPHTAKVMLDFLNTVFGPCINSNCFWIITIVATSGHLSALNWILAASSCGVSWSRSCSHMNHPINLRWEELLVMLCRGIQKEMCQCVMMNLYHRLQEVTWSKGGHMKHILVGGNRCISKMYENCFAADKFPCINYLFTTLYVLFPYTTNFS